MRIGVFGDSFAESGITSDKSWWKRLQTDHGHEVENHGFSGSSILFSANLLLKKYQEYDFNIWCMTTPGRFSIAIPGTDNFFHSSEVFDHFGKDNDHFDTHLPPAINTKIIETCQNYLKYVFDWESENILGKALAFYTLDIIPNLMIIPCFHSPLEKEFNLFEISKKEFSSMFAEEKFGKIETPWQQTCHMSFTNNHVLANLVNTNLESGIFQTKYSNFYFDNFY